MDPFLRRNVLSEGGHVHVAEDRSVKGVEATVGSGRSVGCPTREDRLDLLNGEAGDVP